MKEIKIKILTPKGEEAHKKISKQKQKLSDKLVVKKIFKEKIIQRNPTIVHIKIKIPWLAIKIELPKLIRVAMGKHFAEEGTDYKLEVTR